MSTIRFSGLASGLDTDSIVKDLMRVQQLKVDREKKAQALITLKQEAWKDMQKKLYNFHVKFTDKLRKGSTFNKTIITSSNTNALSINNADSIPQGTHNFEIEKLATATSIAGKIDPTELDATTTVGTLIGELDASKEIALTMSVNGYEDPVIVKVKAGDTLGGVATEMSKALKDKGFVARYDAANGMFFVNSTKTGAGQEIVFRSASGNELGDALFEKLGITATKAMVQKGEDGKYKYNGIEFETTSNTIEVNGIKATFKAANIGEIITISSARDTDSTYTWVKDFVTEYNKLIEELNEKLDTKPAKGIEPLTADEREAMSESDIKLWEEKINNSLFYRDEQLSDFVRISRNILGGIHKESYDGKRDRTTKTREYGEELGYKSLASLGIVTGPWEEKGKLHIQGDEDDELYAGSTNKLKEAIEKDPDAVSALFTTIGAKLYEEHNDRLTTSNDIKSSMKFYNDKLMNDKIKSYDKTIETLEDRMYKMENMYYAKFAAMEKMLNAMNNQSMWLSQQLGGM